MLIIVAHGSHNPSWRASVEKLTESLQVEVGSGKVRLAYMQCTPPTLLDVASDAVRVGVKRIRVLPLFLADEGHVLRDIRPFVDQLGKAFGSLEVDLLPPLGRHPLFKKLLCEIALEGTA